MSTQRDYECTLPLRVRRSPLPSKAGVAEMQRTPCAPPDQAHDRSAVQAQLSHDDVVSLRTISRASIFHGSAPAH